MDQLSRNESLHAELAKSEWDLVVVDEAHRMGAHYFGGKLEKTKRFQLGELLGDIARHLLLMTATPHSGKEEDFQLFLTLLDRDRFEGKYQAKVHSADTSGVMRRMVKEDLLTFEGKPLFPERIAETVPYELTELEQDLYEQVTDLRARGDEPRRPSSTASAATPSGSRSPSCSAGLRPARRRSIARWSAAPSGSSAASRRSSPAARSRSPRPRTSIGDLDEFDDDEFSAEEIEEIEEELVDAATAARTVEELDAELLELADLIKAAARVRASDTDRKWSELRTILEDNTLATDRRGDERRKLIVFTEHRDTLDYLVAPDRLAARPARGGEGDPRRRAPRASDARSPRSSRKNPDCQILLATDAAGEGLNLQAAHLMVNYDLPWNPNRIEQRFGRIHRIGQQEVCRLWNLVADNTREGEVFTRLLEKIEEQRKAYGGKVFDVLGDGVQRDAAAHAADRRDPLRRAARDAKANMEKVIDASVGRRHRGAARRARARHRARCSRPTSPQLRAADGRGAGPAPAAALHRGGVPGRVHPAGRQDPPARAGPLRDHPRPRPAAHQRAAARSRPATTASRSTSSTSSTAPARAPSCSRPATRCTTRSPMRPSRQLARTLDRGTVLVSPTVQEPRLLVGVIEEIADATETSVARRFGYAYIDEHGTVEAAGPAPYLDCVAAPLTDRGDRRPRAAVAGRGRGASGELDHRQPAPGVPERGQAAPRGRASARPRAGRHAPRPGEQPTRPRGDGRPGAGAGRQEAHARATRA